MKSKFCFRVAIETNEATGDPIAVYLQVRKGRVSKTKEYADGNVFADYDRNGVLLGFEILAPCKAAILDKIADDAVSRRFVRDYVPRALLKAA